MKNIVHHYYTLLAVIIGVGFLVGAAVKFSEDDLRPALMFLALGGSELTLVIGVLWFSTRKQRVNLQYIEFCEWSDAVERQVRWITPTAYIDKGLRSVICCKCLVPYAQTEESLLRCDVIRVYECPCCHRKARVFAEDFEHVAD